MLQKSLDSKALDRLICSMNGAAELTEVYEALTRQLSEVSAELGYHCRKGCGACCQGKSGGKEVSVFEMIPMAVEMVRNGSAEKNIGEVGFDGRLRRTALHQLCGYQSLRGPRALQWLHEQAVCLPALRRFDLSGQKRQKRIACMLLVENQL